MQKVLGCFQERLAYSEKPMEDIAGEEEIKMATYYGPEEKGKDQAWILKGTNIEVGGWYCE